MPHSLSILQEQISRRCAATSAAHPFWPCASGCDDCCRSLAAVPSLHHVEWDALWSAIVALPADQLAQVSREMDALCEKESAGLCGSLVCPLLDQTQGICRVYPARPLACRTYGFYVDGADGKYCGKVTAALQQNPDADVVFGNEPSVLKDAERAFGKTRTLTEFWRQRAK